jgi:hypothetical protein
MDINEREEVMFRALTILAAIVALAVSAAPASAFIMRDGNICDPIRHMGC